MTHYNKHQNKDFILCKHSEHSKSVVLPRPYHSLLPSLESEVVKCCVVLYPVSYGLSVMICLLTTDCPRHKTVTINWILTCRYQDGQHQYTTFVTPTHHQAQEQPGVIMDMIVTITIHKVSRRKKWRFSFNNWSKCWHKMSVPSWDFDSFKWNIRRIYESVLIWAMIWRWKFLTLD